MVRRWVGLVASGASVTVVDGDVPNDESDPIVFNADHTWRLQRGERAEAYSVLYQQCSNYLEENAIDLVLIKASAVLPRSPMRIAHLEGAEVRGVVIAAASSVCDVRVLSRAVISRTYGDRNVDEYLKDDEFWEEHASGCHLRGGSREAAMLLVATRGA